jgi:hypothetical protein
MPEQCCHIVGQVFIAEIALDVSRAPVALHCGQVMTLAFATTTLGSYLVALSQTPPPNQTCKFACTWLSSVLPVGVSLDYLLPNKIRDRRGRDERTTKARPTLAPVYPLLLVQRSQSDHEAKMQVGYGKRAGGRVRQQPKWQWYSLTGVFATTRQR